MSHLVGVLGLQVLFTPTLGGAAAASARTCRRLMLALLAGVASNPSDLQGVIWGKVTRTKGITSLYIYLLYEKQNKTLAIYYQELLL